MNTLTALPQSRLPLPSGQAVYAGLSTDHYPWTEVAVDLAARQAQGLNAVFDAQQGDRWVRFVWVNGALRGGFTLGGDVAWPAAMAALPRAQVTLTVLPPAAAELLWASRALPPQPLPAPWSQMQERLLQQRFSGFLFSAGACSFWAEGQVLVGTLPAEDETCAVLLPPAPSAPTPAAMLAFWHELLASTHRAAPLDEVWRQVSVRLAGEHPCLDPFAREVVVAGGQLEVDPDLPPAELHAALRAAYPAVLAQLGVRPADLPLAELRTRPEWTAAGLETT